ncbi:MAG: M1 family aminopeptidase [Acidobacteriaceae bacterium]
MFRHVLSFEVRYWLRSWMLWIFTLIIFGLVLAALSSDEVTIGGALGNTFRNAPWVIENYYSFMAVLTLLMTTAFVNAAAAREFAYNTDQIIFSTPMKKLDFLAGRYIGSALISVVPMLGISFAALLAKYMPWAEADRFGRVIWAAHWKGILVFALPNTFFIAAVVFVIAVLTRSTITSFIGSLALLVGSAVSDALTTDLANEKLAAMIDPFGSRAFAIATKYWTVADKNHLTYGFSGLVFWNRLLWIGVGAALFAFACWRFSFAERGSKAKKKKSAEEGASGAPREVLVAPAVQRQFGGGAQWAQFLGFAKLEFNRLIKTVSFIVITLAALLNCIPSLIFSAREGYGLTSRPVTYRMVEIITGTLYMFLIAMITYYAGVLAWEERDHKIDEVHDATPVPEWPAYAAKFVALMSSIAFIQIVVMVAAVLVQFFMGYHRYQLGLYAENLLGMDLLLFAMLAALAFFIHVLSPNKYIGYFGYIAFLVLNFFLWGRLHVASYLVQFARTPTPTYSDFFGYRPWLQSYSWFAIYWSAFSGLLVCSTIALWQRGKDTEWRYRIRNARYRLHGAIATAAMLFALLFLGSGSWTFYNTKVLNHTESNYGRQLIQADYEKAYKKFEHAPQPRILDVKYQIDLYPETRNLEMRGEQVIKNETGKPLAEVHFSLTPNYEYSIDLPGAQLSKNDQRLRYQIYTFTTPLEPGESRTMRFTVKTNTRGFENTITLPEIMPNGTFFNSTVAPQIGYQAGAELTDRNERKRFGLKEKELMPALERDCDADCRNTYITNNSDWVNVETVISTAPDQIAIAPGSLTKQWTDHGRRYYQYQLDHYSLNFYSFLSARYEVKREHWNGIDIEVYYLKEHPWNVPKMLNSVKKSFTYYTQNYGPYGHKEARIIEFPRVAAFAQAFPGTMPYSESIGFIADIEKPDDIDMVFYVVAHEMAHQWWAHQVIGANMEGATSLSETLAQYSALMVMEHEYGRDTMRKFLKYEMDSYLRNRGRELLKERPLLRVDANQGYVHYRKGSVVMYYLKDMIGEDAVNRALRKVLRQYGYAQPPYPTSYALVDALKEQTPPQYQYLIKDLFSEITLFSNRALSATAKKRADGKYDVTVEVETHKYKADAQGNEAEVPVDDWIEVGALAAPAKGKRYGDVLYRQRVHMSGTHGSYTFVTDKLPDQAGVDPLLMLVDRVPDDNLKKVALRS